RARSINGHRRGLGWDKQSGYSRNRGELMSDAAFGHGGFTGTAMWIDPELDLYMVFLGNRLHPDGVGEVNDLAGRIATMACAATQRVARTRTDVARPSDVNPTSVAPTAGRRDESSRSTSAEGSVKLGIDVLVDDDFKLLDGQRVGLITNQTGLDSERVTTIERLHNAKNVKLVALFSPE